MLESISQWLQRHDLTLDLITIWVLALGFGFFGVAKVVSWLTLRETRDATMVGVTLKRQKIAEALVGFGLATLYGMTLFSYYFTDAGFGFWGRLLVRVGLVIVMALGTWYCVQFVYWLRRESKGNRTGQIPLARDGGEQP